MKSFLLMGLLGSYLFAEATPFFTALKSNEAILQFDFHVNISGNKKPNSEKIQKSIDNQVNHLFGPMAVSKIAATPKGNHSISQVSEPIKKGKYYEVSYHYEGTIQIETTLSNSYFVTLPYNPDTIYKASGLYHKLNPCTDDHYNSEGDFWYFWNPKNEHCKLREGVDYEEIQAILEPITNTQETYPEYEKLIRKIDGEDKIIISVFFGRDEVGRDANPLTSHDENAANYRLMRQKLIRLGFNPESQWTKKDLGIFLKNSSLKGTFFIEELTLKTLKANFLVRLFFGATAIDENSQIFHWMYREALRNSSIMIYNGHSGLGDHLDLEYLENNESFKIGLSENYQIYYFNSCSSYTYYNTQYFQRKKSSTDPKGTKKLDILTNGLLTFFHISHDTDAALIKAIISWAYDKKETSYQELAKQIDDNNLFGINGDEDNPTTLNLIR